jgi:hemerythrin-like domain-containing protein
MKMDVYVFLRDEHKAAKKLLESLEKTTDRSEKTRERLFLDLKKALELHMYLEESMLYPVLKDKKPSADIALEAYEEHDVVKHLLEELEQTPEGDETWKAKLAVLKENIEHHIEEEESELFKKARQVFSDAEAEKLGAAMATKKAEQLAVQS